MFGVSFLFPAFLAGSLAVAVPVVLHLLRREAAPRQPFSAVRFLKPAPVEQARRKRLRELFLLALRVAALLLLAAAFARPYVAGASASASSPVTVVAVDVSMSLSAPGQRDRLRARAVQAIDDAPADHLVGVVAFADEATVVADPSATRQAARDAVAALEPGYGATNYGAALARAAEVLAGRRGRVVVVTDLQRTGLGSPQDLVLPGAVTVDVAPIETPAGNLAVESVRHAGGATRVIVRHAGEVPLTTRVSLAVDDEVVAEQVVELTDGEATDVELAVTWPSEGAIEVRVEDAVGFQGDNARFMVADQPAPTEVLIVGRDGTPADDAFYLTSALSVDDEQNRFRVTGGTAERLPEAAGDGGSFDRFDAVVLTSTRSLARAGWETLLQHVDSGAGLLVALGPDVDTDVVSQMLPDAPLGQPPDATPPAPRSLAVTDLRHPIFRPYASVAATLGQVRFERTVPMDDSSVGDGRGATAQTIARFSDGRAALVEVPVGEGTVLLFGSDLDRVWNDLPLHAAFVPFVHEAVRYIARDGVAPREYLVGARGSEVSSTPGVHLDAASGRRIVVNADPRESSLERVSAEEFTAAIRSAVLARSGSTVTQAAEVERQQSWWRYGLILMLVVLAAEGVVGGRLA
jgi:hypothetical protein